MADIVTNKRNCLVGPRAGLSRKDFHAHWSGQHAKFARELPGLIWYVQNHYLRTLWRTPGFEEHSEGLAELAYADGAAIVGNIQNWSGLDELLEDEARFLGMWTGCWTNLPADAASPAQRRILIQLIRPEAVPPAEFSARVAAAAAAIRNVLPCSTEETLNKLVRERPVLECHTWPDWFIFVELPVAGDFAALLSPEGPVLRHVNGLTDRGVAYLVYAEAKRLPVDLAAAG